MNNLHGAIDDLRKYNSRKESLINIPERIQALRLDRESVRAVSDSTPVQGGGSRAEDRVINSLCNEEHLRLAYKSNKHLVAVTERALATLTDTERLVLERFYIARPKDYIEVLKIETNYEKTRIYEIRDEALRKYAMAAYGAVET